MNKNRFRLLVFFMSLSLLGIILVQLYWVNSSLRSKDEQFKFHVQQILERAAKKLEQQEAYKFLEIYNRYKDSTGNAPTRADLLPLYDRNITKNTRKSIIFSDKIIREYDDVLFDKEKIDYLVGEKKKQVRDTSATIEDIESHEEIDEIEKFKFIGFIKDFRQYNYLESWVTKETVNKLLSSELKENGVDTPFEFAIFNNGLATKIKSDNLKYISGQMYDHPIFTDAEGNGGRYRLLVSFPEKRTYLFSLILGITSLSLVFTTIIIIAYLSAINQLIKQKHISEIKTDFINNMTHEFKTPIATINLALDAIKNPKISEDAERRQRYLQMIRDENKRMHAQVENVLQISKLDKRELEINKEPADLHEMLDNAIEHVHLIIEAEHGTLTRYFEATRTTALLNDVHFTNVLVNILDNAIKYSPDGPVIDIYTENVKDFVLVKISDKGLGMSKNTQKRIFEKFYREHTGDIHNVKGHGLGLAYVKRIIEDHNCHIYVESEKGKGSTFIIKVPLIN
ncbi:sensor histidine kinase [Flavobacterium rhizosphaerae]|uniref:histidine kinase n=1 Tax=Flavobacterium rhizosphaerae TaxID=3163298 RepID=A0ABW8YXP1_9FLAO